MSLVIFLFLLNVVTLIYIFYDLKKIIKSKYIELFERVRRLELEVFK